MPVVYKYANASNPQPKKNAGCRNGCPICEPFPDQWCSQMFSNKGDKQESVCSNRLTQCCLALACKEGRGAYERVEDA